MSDFAVSGLVFVDVFFEEGSQTVGKCVLFAGASVDGGMYDTC